MSPPQSWRDSPSKRAQAKVIAQIGYRLVSALGSTLRWRTEGLEHFDGILASGRQPIMAFWHGRILSATYYFRRRGIVVITSENFDGEWIAGIIERFGYGTARGSTSRGGRRALLQLTREMAAGKAAGFTVTLQQVDPADLLTDVYIKGEGNAVLSEQLSNGPDLANNFENEFLPIGFLTQHYGTANPLLAPYIKEALQYVTAQQQGPFMQKAGALAMSIGAEVPLVFQPSIIGYNKSVVGGTVQAPIGQCHTNLTGIYIKK